MAANVLARLIDPDGQTVAEFAIPYPPRPFLERAALVARYYLPGGEVVDERSVALPDPARVCRLTYDLTTYLGIEDGGPLAVYHRRKVTFAG